MKLHSNMRVLCICRKGQVRSVAARRALVKAGFRKVVACGWGNTDDATVHMLCEWADAILVVGSASSWYAVVPDPMFDHKTARIDIGPDVYGRFDHPELIGILQPKIEALL